ncbi:MAG: hypothetical protein A2622_11000 [Bdellovibrionales bacterium RIFCSPHIGHO2_01_FULL_40_29]|nr:MAG: hypothetical protein A2622_11000 [Bdellovibrionales bacterium RIFCSPHIGHO2_01_FULL_40_29]OFZ34481.1 MAG: hypothetical protein A3D17_01265 [Bdellovibrionales bacterium RIFCSPHIGHO2_02_FULL_40_15]
MLLSLLGFAYYPGSNILFGIFSLSMFGLIILNNKKTSSPSIVFLSWMLWLGFFQKIVFHLFTKFQFITELIGRFSGTNEQWDQVLLVAILAALGVTLTSIAIDHFKSRENYFSLVLGRYPKNTVSRFIPWFAAAVCLLVLGIGVLNVMLGINLSGIVAMTVLVWPLNAVIGWLLYLGFAIVFVFLVDWEISVNKKITYSFLFFAVGAFFCSVSIISRGLFVFHIAPILYLLYRNQKQYQIPRSVLTMASTIVLLLFLVNTSAVTILRNYFYDNDFSRNEWIEKEVILQGQKPTVRTSSNQVTKLFSVFENKPALSQVAGLVVNRWIGAEGVMAVVSYPEKGFHLVVQTLLRKPAVGEFDLYEKIINTQYTPSQKFSFANIPGPAAFLFYSGSFVFVFLGFVFFSALLHFFDYLVWKSFNNSFLSALIGFYLAISIAQFGISPRPLFISMFMTFVGLFIIYLIFSLLKFKNWKTLSIK